MILSYGTYLFLGGQLMQYEGNYLEIGVYEGDALHNFAKQFPHKKFFGIDPFISDPDTTGHHGIPVGERLEKKRELALANFADMPNITLFEQTSKSFMEEMSQDSLDWMNVSIVNIDGRHTYEDTMNDFLLAERLIRTKGLVYMDDWVEATLRAQDEFFSRYQSRIIERSGSVIRLKPKC